VVKRRSKQHIEVNARVSVGLEVQGAREFHDLVLEREKVVLFPLSWTVVHAIDESSPLWGMDEAALREAAPEFLVTIEAMDETFAQQVHSRTSYTHDEIVWGARFADLFVRRPGRLVGIDVARLHEYEPAPLPSSVGA
jgi:inward rectifier potassium channel